MRRKYFLVIGISVLGCMLLLGCDQHQQVEEEQDIIVETNESKTSKLQEPVSETLPEKEQQSENEESDLAAAKVEPLDLGNCFIDKKGCMAIFDQSEKEWLLYNEAMANEEASPFSTFKIVSALIGLQEGVLENVDSTMGYDGSQYPIDSWNKDLTLKEAFQNSCVWYFNKVINQVGPEKVSAYLKELHYGNGDVSEWKGSNINPTDDTNGFWLNASLKISPKEQAEVIHHIFEGETSFSPQNVEIVKEIMYAKAIGDCKIYGKTGTGLSDGWFAGFFEKGDKKYYFATHIVGDETHKVSGQEAKDITYKVIEQFEK